MRKWTAVFRSTGKDVTYADVKQAHRAAENLLEQAGPFAALACAEGRPPGDHWMVVKAVCQGRIAYGPAIAVRITGG
ncbi:hypothetical protein ACFWBF_23515 [Streptomyces sp. NPDC060028]|uniref:hypothetical protein n=1 Tax=Streptomyces sp. NPDC060028 TaxID=3347041 RepID=UPI0036BB8F9B